jgi:hypothetical protein
VLPRGGGAREGQVQGLTCIDWSKGIARPLPETKEHIGAPKTAARWRGNAALKYI